LPRQDVADAQKGTKVTVLAQRVQMICDVASTVVEELSLQLGVRAAVFVPDDGVWFVAQFVAAEQRLVEEVRVFADPRWYARPERLFELAHIRAAQQAGAKRRIRGRSQVPGFYCVQP